MHDYETAVKLLIDHSKEIALEKADLDALNGRILAEYITAEENVPSFDRSPYDGYAFIASDTSMASKDTPVTLKVLENIRAGEIPRYSVSQGSAIRLMTGAPIPDGADAVCKYEDTEFTEEEVRLKRSYRPGENVIRSGEDIKKGSLLACSGMIVDTGIIGILASLGITKVKVFRKPVAGIISTGDEVIDINAPLYPGAIRNTNKYLIASALKSLGMETVYLGHACDDADKIKELILNGEGLCDIIVSTGGVSKGDYDLVPEAMENSGYEIFVRGVDIKPGMACAYGKKNDRLMLALSGNPASSLTNLQCVCYPALRKLMGISEYEHKIIPMRLKKDINKHGRALRLLRGRIELTDGYVVLDAAAEQGNIVISSTKGCNAYGIIPALKDPFKAGDVIKGFVIGNS